MNSFLSGFGLSFGLIAAIGAQNAFILRHGLLRQHVFLLCGLCALSDTILISLGVGGFSLIIAQFPQAIAIASYGGAAFLFFYGAKSFYAFLSVNHHLDASGDKKSSLPAVISTWAAITWLNPHVYLDTIVLLGSASAPYHPLGQEWLFAGGAACASFAFFYSLGYGARLLTPLFKKPITWKLLELAIGIIMWRIAWQVFAAAPPLSL
ncbi:MAG: LysE/ArgO family amino acid transporter [Hydrotalea sp.]|nr:LysE/ArgO family amino acid transporter [Hydrotalea sp.]